MKKQKILIISLTTMLVSALTGCGTNNVNDITSSMFQNKDNKTEEKLINNQDNETQKNVIDNQDDTTQENLMDNQDTNSSVEGTEVEPKYEGQNNNEDTNIIADNGIIDFNKMQFSINGKMYTLGETTLQTLIDDGVPFDKDHLANAGNNLNAHDVSPRFKIELGKYIFAQVAVINLTEENKPMSECVINTIYMPNNNDKKQDILKFAFPFTITPDEIISKCGKPTDIDERVDGNTKNVDISYTKEATMYIAHWGYEFEFINDELRYISMDYIP